MKSSGGESEFALMRFFKRKSANQTVSPSSVQDYYQTEQTGHKAMAWLLAIATFIVTLLVILALFFAGRWLSHKINHKNSGTSGQTTQPQGDTSQVNGSNDKSQSTDGSVNSNQQKASNNTTPSNAPPQTSSTSTSTPSRATTPATGDTLVKTGPDEDL